MFRIAHVRPLALLLGAGVLIGLGAWAFATPAEAEETIAAPATAEDTTTLQATRPARPAPRPVAPAAGNEFPEDWFYPDRTTGRRYAQLKQMEGKPAPEFKLHSWIGEAQDLKKVRGKVVVVDFWATWCGPCMRAIPENVEMVRKYGESGLVIVGIHDHRRGTERMAAAVQQTRINYPVGIDQDGFSQTQYRVRFWPTYAVIDHKGIVRASGIMPHHIEKVVKKLLDERAADIGKR